MILHTPPPDIHTIFNPVLLTVKGTIGLPEELLITEVSSKKSTSAYVDFTDEYEDVEIGGLLKTLLGQLYRDNNLPLTVDDYQSIKYTLSYKTANNVYKPLLTKDEIVEAETGKTIEPTEYTAVNSVAQVQEAQNLHKQKGKLLTGFNKLYAYQYYDTPTTGGTPADNYYPADVSILGDTGTWKYEEHVSSSPIITPIVANRVNRLRYNCNNPYVKIDAKPDEITCTIKWGDPMCQLITSNPEIKQTNNADGDFTLTALGQDNKLYFGGPNGIWYLDNDGLIKPTNKTGVNFRHSTMGQDGRLYFGGANNGIWYLDNDGLIKPSNKTDGYFEKASLGQDGRLYFAGGSGNGIWYLDNDGLIKPSNKTNGSFYCVSLGQDGRLYFGGANGVWYLDNDGLIKPSNKTDGNFNSTSLGQDGKLYFGSPNGVWYLDNDGLIKPTNKTDGYFYCVSLGQDGRLYFGGNNNGIWYLDNDGLIKPSNKTDGYFACAGLGQDGKLFFGGAQGVWYLDNDGLIKPTNKTGGYFACTGLGQDSKLYFAGLNYSGIWYLDKVGTIENTGQALAKTATYKKYINGVEVESLTKNILTDITPTLSEAQYNVMSDLGIDNRAQQLIASFSPCTDLQHINTVREQNQTLCPYPFISINDKPNHDISFDGCEPKATQIIIDSSSPWTIQGAIPAWLNMSVETGSSHLTLIDIDTSATDTDRQASLTFVNDTQHQATLNVNQTACNGQYEWELNDSDLTEAIDGMVTHGYQNYELVWTDNESPYDQPYPTPPPTHNDYINGVTKPGGVWDYWIKVFDGRTDQLDYETSGYVEFYFEAIQSNII